jgi:transcriptional regulator with XRE-family HTH domain
MFPNLKLEIFRRCSHQNRLARAVGMDETVLSKIIHGYRNPRADQRKLLAAYLEADEDWLFECFEAPTAPMPNRIARPAEENRTGDDGDPLKFLPRLPRESHPQNPRKRP